MKYYSELTKKMYDTEQQLFDDEARSIVREAKLERIIDVAARQMVNILSARNLAIHTAEQDFEREATKIRNRFQEALRKLNAQDTAPAKPRIEINSDEGMDPRLKAFLHNLTNMGNDEE